MNDAVLTIVGGALRHYLAAKGELPDTLTAMAPISVRTESDQKTSAGNQVRR